VLTKPQAAQLAGSPAAARHGASVGHIALCCSVIGLVSVLLFWLALALDLLSRQAAAVWLDRAAGLLPFPVLLAALALAPAGAVLGAGVLFWRRTRPGPSRSAAWALAVGLLGVTLDAALVVAYLAVLAYAFSSLTPLD
jgi:hypothetical protein